MAIDEIVHVVVDHGVWGLVLVVAVIVARSRPSRELSWCISIEIRWRYLKWKGVPDSKLQQLLRDGWNDDGSMSGQDRSQET